jgi:hypothetical protein
MGDARRAGALSFAATARVFTGEGAGIGASGGASATTTGAASPTGPAGDCFTVSCVIVSWATGATAAVVSSGETPESLMDLSLMDLSLMDLSLVESIWSPDVGFFAEADLLGTL